MKDGDKYHGEKGVPGEGYGNKQDGQEDPTEKRGPSSEGMKQVRARGCLGHRE